jgi:hypothetical protein
VAALRQFRGHFQARGARHLNVEEEGIHLLWFLQPGEHGGAIHQLGFHLAARFAQ